MKFFSTAFFFTILAVATAAPQREQDEELVEKRYNNNCDSYTRANVDDVIGCYNQIMMTPYTTGGVQGGSWAQISNIGSAQVILTTRSGVGYAASAYQDIGSAVQWIFTYCNNGGQVGGSAAAGGNGDLIVSVNHVQ